MKNKFSVFITIIFITFFLTSCATIFLGTKQDVSIKSTPSGADVYVNGKSINKQTPCEIKLNKKNTETQYNKKNEVAYTFKKDGYKDTELKDMSHHHWLIYLDASLYFIPMIVDVSTKAHRIYKTDIQVDLLPKQIEIVDNTPPEIIITSPNVTRGFKPVSANKEIAIAGVVTDESEVYEVLINGEEINMQNNGAFSHTVLLAMGDNSFTITATDTKRNTTTKQFTIERNSNKQETQVVNNQTNNNILQTGKYYALIIGNNSYQDPAITSLDEPINDATKLYNVLTTEYTFERQNVTFLKNATYVQMIEAFDHLSNIITPNDNLLVFYAGHGWWDETKKLGYWLPTDAKKSSTAFWIANSRISDYMGSINSKHTLLIADACFSGSIFKTRSAFADAQPAINKLYELPSKKAMTSGNLKEVPDQSVFLEYLVKRLKNNKEKYISADMLFASFRQAVMNNSPTEPQFGTIQNAGDEGGEFIFIRKK